MDVANRPAIGKAAVGRTWNLAAIADRAEGVYIWDVEGRRYLDGSAGSSAVVNIGHGVKEIRDAIYAQMEKAAYVAPHVFTNEAQQRLGEIVAATAPGEMRNAARTWFACTGTDAVDDAIRLARQYFVARGKRSKTLVISRWQGFHGNNIAVAGMHGHTARRRLFVGMNINSPHIPPANCYRCPFELQRATCNLKCARALETEIRQQGEENVAAFIAEPVVGAALGAVPAPDGYFEVIREICDRYDVLFVADEVMCGWGRAGYRYAIEAWRVTPDIIACAKGMTSGYVTLAATVAREDLWQTIEDTGVPYWAGHTMDLNPVACAGALAVIDYMDTHDLEARSREQGAYLLERLREFESSPIVGDVRGMGLMCGIEFVRDKVTKEPFAPDMRVSGRFQAAALERGLILFSCTGSVDGVAGDMMLITPPLSITRAEIDEMVAIMADALADLEEQVA